MFGKVMWLLISMFAGVASTAIAYSDGVFHIEKSGDKTTVADNVIIWDDARGGSSAPGYRNLSYYHWDVDAQELVLESTNTYDLKQGQKLSAVFSEGGKRKLLFDSIAGNGFNVRVKKDDSSVMSSVLFCIGHSASSGYEVIGDMPKATTEVQLETGQSIPFSIIARIDFGKGNQATIRLNDGKLVQGTIYGPAVAGVLLDSYLILASRNDYKLAFVDVAQVESIEFVK